MDADMPELRAMGSDVSVCPRTASPCRGGDLGSRGGDLGSRGRWGGVCRETGQCCDPRRAATGLEPSPAPQLCHERVLQPCRSPCPLFVPAASAGLLENCTGCVLCSEDNGCITCHHRLFLLIWRDGIRQYGMCVHTCPPGYFGVRGLEVNRCTSTSRASQGPPLLPVPPCPLAHVSHGGMEPGAVATAGRQPGHGVSSPFPLPRAAAWTLQVCKGLWVPGGYWGCRLRAHRLPALGLAPLTSPPSRQSAGRPAARAASAETSA